MTMLTRLEQWKERGIMSPEQQTHLAALSRGEPFSVTIELNVLLYAGVLAFIAGLGWTISTWSQQLGDVLVLTILSAMLAACSWYCSSRSPAWSPAETPSPSLVFDYVIYFGSLVWSVEIAYLENRFHLLSGEWSWLPFTAVDMATQPYRRHPRGLGPSPKQTNGPAVIWAFFERQRPK